jgi:septal ring factor EnvC (AmiA/AmiB activator)
MNTPTPRTDELEGNLIEFCDNQIRFSKMTDHAKTLERELTAVTEQRDQWKDKYLQQNKDLGYELRDPNGTIWSECKRLQTELTAARAEIEQLREANRIISGREGEWIAKAHYEIDCLREQRDRLAKAVNAATILIAAKGRHNTMLAYEGLRDALQSLTTNEL